MSVCSSSRRRAAVRRWLRQAEARDNRREHRPAPCPSTGCEHLGLATARHVYQQSNLLALSSTDALNVDHSPLRPSSLVLLLLPPPLALSSASWAPRPRVPVFDSGSVNPLPHLYPRRSAAHPASVLNASCPRCCPAFMLSSEDVCRSSTRARAADQVALRGRSDAQPADRTTRAKTGLAPTSRGGGRLQRLVLYERRPPLLHVDSHPH